jgi:hypothetical protein
MHTSPGVVPVLSISRVAEDHRALQDILRLSFGNNRTVSKGFVCQRDARSL